MKLSTALTLILPFTFSSTFAAANYCSGKDFKPTEQVCKKFEFDQLKDLGQCTDSSKKTTGDFKGVELSNCTTFYDISGLPNGSIDDHTKTMAYLITNVFENGNTKMGFAAAEKLGDCRGYTCGYIGFTTGTDDAYAVVKEYVKREPSATIGSYVDALKQLTTYGFGDPKRDDTSKLSKFPQAWKNATCSDPVFIQTQLDVGEAMYLKPAVKYAASAGVTSNLGKAIFYDTIVQHGWQYVEPYINLPRILELTGAKKSGESEKEYLTRFLTTRRQLVCCYPGGVWNDSADRMQDWQTLVDNWEQNKDLKNKVTLKIYGESVTGKEDIHVDSQRCKGKKKSTKAAKSISMPIPDTCDAKGKDNKKDPKSNIDDKKDSKNKKKRCQQH